MRALLSVCASLLICAPAYAHVPGLKHYWPLAKETFPPLCENPRVVQVHELDDSDTAARAWPDECRIEFPAKGLHDWPAWLVCSVLVHEVGHLHRYQDPVGVQRDDGTVDYWHSPDPDSVMHPVITRPYGPCAALIRRTRSRHR